MSCNQNLKIDKTTDKNPISERSTFKIPEPKTVVENIWRITFRLFSTTVNYRSRGKNVSGTIWSSISRDLSRGCCDNSIELTPLGHCMLFWGKHVCVFRCLKLFTIFIFPQNLHINSNTKKSHLSKNTNLKASGRGKATQNSARTWGNP